MLRGIFLDIEDLSKCEPRSYACPFSQPLCEPSPHTLEYSTNTTAERGDERNRSPKDPMALSRRSLATLSMLASALSTAEALAVEAGTIVGVSVDAPVFDTRTSAPYGCPPAGCLGDNTRVSASCARHLLFSPCYVLDYSTAYVCISHSRAGRNGAH